MPSSNNVETMFVQHLGQNKSLLQVITVYRPNFKDAAQFQTIYLQHCKRFLLEQRQLQCGLNNFSRLIHEWMDAGEHKVLMMDANEDVQTGETKQFFEHTDMQDVVISMHGNDTPYTHIDGSQPIDRIFATG
jgi:hypothetical protein